MKYGRKLIIISFVAWVILNALIVLASYHFNHQEIDFISAFGVSTSIIGLAVALVEINHLKSAAEKTQERVTEVMDIVKHALTVDDVNKGKQIVSLLNSSLQHNHFQVVLIKLAELIEVIHYIENTHIGKETGSNYNWSKLKKNINKSRLALLNTVDAGIPEKEFNKENLFGYLGEVDAYLSRVKTKVRVKTPSEADG